MIETTIEVTDSRVPGTVIADILGAGQEMLSQPIEPLPHARGAVEALAGRARLMLVTKGDLLDQRHKLAKSGLGEVFDSVEIVSEKTARTYARLCAGAGRAMMVGNPLRSDVLPALETGAWGLHVPRDLTWVLEQADPPEPPPLSPHRRCRRAAGGAGEPRLARDLAAASALLSPQSPMLRR